MKTEWNGLSECSVDYSIKKLDFKVEPLQLAAEQAGSMDPATLQHQTQEPKLPTCLLDTHQAADIQSAVLMLLIDMYDPACIILSAVLKGLACADADGQENNDDVTFSDHDIGRPAGAPPMPLAHHPAMIPGVTCPLLHSCRQQLFAGTSPFPALRRTLQCFKFVLAACLPC